jgi:hypothetical protein
MCANGRYATLVMVADNQYVNTDSYQMILKRAGYIQSILLCSDGSVHYTASFPESDAQKQEAAV